MYKNTFKNWSKYAVLLIKCLISESFLLCVFHFPNLEGLPSPTVGWPRWRLQNMTLSSHRKPAILQTLSWRVSLSPTVFPVSVSLIRTESLCPKGYL